jgi:hypothetical protein
VNYELHDLAAMRRLWSEIQDRLQQAWRSTASEGPSA